MNIHGINGMIFLPDSITWGLRLVSPGPVLSPAPMVPMMQGQEGGSFHCHGGTPIAG